MARHIGARLTYANVMATIAVFLGLGGVGYAVTKLPAKSVGPAQLKRNAVTSSKVKNRSLRAIDFGLGQLPRGARGPGGAAGASGRDGVNGRDGAQGPAGLSAAGFGHVGGGPVLSTTYGTVADTSSSVDHSGPVTTTIPGRFILTGSVVVFKDAPDAANTGTVQCRLQIGSGGTFANTTGYARVTLPPVASGVHANATIPLTAVVDEPAGTYDARVQCSQFTETGAPAVGAVDDATVTVAVAKQPGP
jgi:hypothetical protein